MIDLIKAMDDIDDAKKRNAINDLSVIAYRLATERFVANRSWRLQSTNLK